MKSVAIIEAPTPPILVLHKGSKVHCERIRLLMSIFDLSLADVVARSGKSISKSQFHRILHGQQPTPFECRAIALGLLECLKARMDSAYLFDGAAQ